MVEVRMEDRFAEYKKCSKCGAGFDRLYIGGVGVWRTSILCEKCHHVHRNVPYRQVIVHLIAEQYDLTYNEALERDQAAQAEYEANVAEEADF